MTTASQALPATRAKTSTTMAVTRRAMRILEMMTQGMTKEPTTAAVKKANKTDANRSEQDNFSPASCQRAVTTVFLNASRLWRVRLVVRTQPSQGWYTGSTPVRAAHRKAGL